MKQWPCYDPPAMSLLIQANDLHFAHGGQVIFDGLSLEIKERERLALLGPNGSGKSTLFRLLTQELKSSSGAVTHQRGLRIGYLPQQTVIDPEMTVLETVALAAGDPDALEYRLMVLEDRMASASDDGALIAILDEHNLILTRLDDSRERSDAGPGAAILAGLRVPEKHWKHPLGMLSGGEKKIVALAGLLAQQPDVLLLDEPDNHLDIEAKIWLEDRLAAHPGAVATITHDRTFVDRVSNRIFELENRRLSVYYGNYTTYRLEKRNRIERALELRAVQESEYRKLKASSEQLTQWARQNPKFASRAENQRRKLEEARKALDAIPAPRISQRTAEFTFNADRGGTLVAEALGASARYGDRVALQPFDLTIRFGERIAVVGPNGAGKTTLVNLLLGRLQPAAGSIRIGASVTPGHYAQEQETLPARTTPIEHMRSIRPLTEQQAISFLNSLLLDRDRGMTQIGALSGGEQARLQIGSLILAGTNFLLLDEPTNNLDIPSIESLEEALLEFDGAILTISHDRYFLERLCTRTLAIDAGRIVDHAGPPSALEHSGHAGTALSRDSTT